MFEFFKDRTNQIIIVLLVVFSIISLWLRLLPMFNMGNTDILSMVASDDPLYNLRQVEQIMANYPNYAWYDPMTLFPTGSVIYWGPLFPTLIATVALMLGATTRPEVIAIGLIIPPIMGMLMIPVMYFIGKIAGDWKTGLLTAGFTTIVSGQFFYRSLYGYMDHHIAEVLFSTIFCLLYMYVLYSEKDNEIVLNNFSTYKNLVIISICAGIAYVIGLLVMPTMILFAMIVGMFTALQFIIDVLRRKPTEYLLLINTIIFSIAIIGIILFGFKTQGLYLSSYSIGHVYAYLGLIGVTGFLYLLAQRFKETPLYYPLSLGGLGAAGAFILMIVNPIMYNLLIKSFFYFFGQIAVTNTVQEAMGWTVGGAWNAFNFGLYLMIFGTIVLLIRNVKDEHPYQIFILVWSLTMLLSTWQHVRYEYYLAVNIVLLSAVFITFVIEKGLPDMKLLSDKLVRDIDKEEPVKPVKSKGKHKQVQYKKEYKIIKPNYLIVLLVILTLCIGGMFVFTSGMINYSIASGGGQRMNPDWKGTLEWMSTNTPDVGFNYTEIQDVKTFKYPDTAYGVMSWWDYGHMITYIAKRIPNANPFQQGVTEEAGASNFFIATNESVANQVLDIGKTRYVITDIEMDTGKFYAMATWHNSTVSAYPYQQYFIVEKSLNTYTTVMLNSQDYYLTMISRLHNFDGSYVEPTQVYYIEYEDAETAKMSGPLVTNAQVMNYTDAQAALSGFNAQYHPSGSYATVASPIIVLPVSPVPALQHYRLVHESPSNVLDPTSGYDIKYVKTFEYVKGAHIKGEGFIEVPILTNTGRKFVYIQQSVNGEFVVPYSTIGNSYGVKAVDKYHIYGAYGNDKFYDVTENDVMQGLIVE
jgi:dolichyl-phosphooligosaccharide-protein glycotransferase